MRKKSDLEKKEDMTRKTPLVLNYSTKTWYGLPVDITVSSNNLHRISVPGLTLPHPGLVNIISRWGLPLETRLVLTSRHEFGHLQTLPVPAFHMLLLLWPRQGRPAGSHILRWLVAISTHIAVWELAAECYVLAINGRIVKNYRSPLARWLYYSFWGGMAALVVSGTRFLFQRNKGKSR